MKWNEHYETWSIILISRNVPGVDSKLRRNSLFSKNTKNKKKFEKSFDNNAYEISYTNSNEIIPNMNNLSGLNYT